MYSRVRLGQVHTILCLSQELDLAGKWPGDPVGSLLKFACAFIPTCCLSLWLLSGLCDSSSRLWAEPCSTGQCGCRNPLLCSCVELPNDLRVRPESRVPRIPVDKDRRLQHCCCRRHGKYEQGKASEEMARPDHSLRNSVHCRSRVD